MGGEALDAQAQGGKQGSGSANPAPKPTKSRKPAVAAPGFPVVGIGASAGGLAAFEAFFSGMPSDAEPGMAFVLVQHLAPDHKSLLTEIIKRYTRMEVLEVEDGMIVRPNCTYIIPPNRDMALLNGSLKLLKPTAPRGHRLPVDFFFRSLAQDQHERAICIVLSGTGSDGTLGVRAVKGEGGIAMVQDVDSAGYDGMPRSAIATGLVDYVLPATEMSAQLTAYASRSFAKGNRQVAAEAPSSQDAIKKILVLLRSETGHDFSGYKLKTLVRRTQRRMAACQIEQMDVYALHLQQDSSEIEALYRDLLIGVTSFFRDPGAFKALQEQVIPRLVDGRAANEEVRVWVPGCSTGEEAYSIAILIKERLVELKVYSQVKIFATDIDAKAIMQARAGVYPASIVADVSPERLSHFFVQEAGSDTYRVQKFIRDMLIFSEQDVIASPPFSRVDLISCRNLLIYMGGDLQNKLISLFHYALAPGGCLFLGTSETAGGSRNLFVPLDLKAKLYERAEPGVGRARVAARGRSPMAAMRVTASPAPGRPREARRDPLRELTERTLLLQHATAAALVSERGDILYLHGRTGSYLEPAPGDAGMNILTMAREGLRRGLTTALSTAALRKESVRRTALRVKTNGDFKLVDLTVQPAVGGSGAETEPDLFVVMLEETQTSGLRQADTSAGREAQGGSADASLAGEEAVAALRQELDAKEEYLQATFEEMETSNEELQSVNEELETSTEELQSLNEELGTVNAELQNRISDLTQSNNDMNNLLAGTGIGTIFVDLNLNIQRFTPTATRVINLIAADAGRPIGHIVSNLAGYDSLVSDIHAVLDTLEPSETEVQALDGGWYLLRILPYRTLENAIEGAAITFTEITELKRVQAALNETEGQRRLVIVVRDAHDAISVQDLEGRILAWNPSATRMYGWTESEALEMNIRELIPEGQVEPALEIVRRLSRAEVLEPYRTERITKDGRTVGVWLTATALLNPAGDMYAIATTEREAVADV